MARRGLSAGMSGREKALGGAVLALYLAVLPYVSGPALDLLERLLGTRLGESVRNAIYYYVVFALVVIVFWGYLGRTTRAFLDRPGGVLASAGLGLVAFYGLNEIWGWCWRDRSISTTRPLWDGWWTRPGPRSSLWWYWLRWWRRPCSGGTCSGTCGRSTGGWRTWSPACCLRFSMCGSSPPPGGI